MLPCCHAAMTLRRDLLSLVTSQPRSVSSLARELGLKRGDVEEGREELRTELDFLRKGDVEDDLRHMIRSARAAGHRVVIDPARCKACGFVFGEDKLSKPSRCPQCRQSRIFEAQIRVEQP